MRFLKFLFFGCLLAFVSPEKVSAQNPGYLGKRAVLEFSFGGKFVNDDYITGGISVEPVGYLTFGYAVTRSGLLSISAGRYSANLRESYLSNFDPDKFDINVNTFGIEYGFTKSSTGFISPIGRVFFLGFEYQSIDVQDYEPDEYYFEFSGETKFNLVFVTVGWEKRGFLSDNFYWKGRVAGKFTPDWHEEAFDVRTEFFDAVQWANYLELEIGVGALIF